ncbi:MAG: AAA family ATPase [Betaproteobacteria bacterium]|nr:AAA family ATPase [Betaproteobacteria bacterium]
MISVESIRIKEFRGIRDLTLHFNGRSFGICGPNGTGKSGVVDALEFAMTGDLSRLSGEGKGEVSLKQHGPHVDQRNNPAKSRVAVTVTIPSLGKTVTIERSVKTPTAPQVTPSDPDVLKVLKRVEAHPEIVLSRRELIRYVLATPGQRAEEVQALLHLEQLERVRTGLQKIANAREKQLPGLETAARVARDHFLQALNLAELRPDAVLAATNEKRGILGLALLPELTEKTNLKDGMAVPTPVQPQRIPKIQAAADINGARDAIAEIATAETATRVAEVRAEINILAGDPAVAQTVKHESFLSTGIELANDAMCPFCDTPWDLAELKGKVQEKIDHLKEATRKRTTTEKKMTPLIAALKKVETAVEGLLRYAALAKPPVAMQAASAHVAGCKALAARLGNILPLKETVDLLATIPTVPQRLFDEINALDKAVAALPDPSKQDAARDWLTIAQERLEAYRGAMRKRKIAKDEAQIARQASDVYVETSDKVLSGVYAAVQKDFAALYGFVNRSDEQDFKAQLTPSMGKLGFDVDFYGRGFFPPGAYHSEGHQDGMGLCLYLALMRHIQGKDFTFAVLDDVLMSVDAGHRREVCTLLKKEFPNTQFVMTTHDPIWLRHMRTEGLTGPGSSVQFRTWTVDQGPAQWDDRDVWAEIQDYLQEDNVRAAASLLRHFLEYTSADLCHRLRASVEFRGDAQYQLGELLPAAIRRLRTLYKRGKDAANSWGQKDVVQSLDSCSAKCDAVAVASNAEQWQVNAAIHFNSWENLTKRDFQPVVKAFQDLLQGFACTACGERLRVSPERETAESFRCECGKTNVNLRNK